MAEELIITLQKIAEFCGFSLSTAKRMRKRMIDGGIVFRRRRKCGSFVFCAWPDDLKKFTKG